MFKLNATLIRELLIKRGLSISAFAKQAGLHEFTARKVIADGAKVTMKTIGALAAFFGVNGEELILKG